MKTFLLLLATLTLLGTGYGQNYNFLGEYTSDGTPLYFDEKDEVSQETLDLIADALPEGFPVPDYNPQYITSGYDTDIVLNEDAEVWVTFVGEGAGYRNVLGFYTYAADDPNPQKPEPEDITIIFPNVSAKNSGGSLEVGHKVKIGTFPEGTAIGWVLLANGWKGYVTSGLWQLYSGIDFNPEPEESLRYHNVLLNDPDNERIILGFEDIRRDYASCDQDFNDALFYITANPYTAIETTNYNEITDHAPVSSGNDGGLESNGDLARLIAKRNFDRNKTNSFKNTKKRQSKYDKRTYKSLGAKSGELDAYFPSSGMFGTETTYVSSPEDLLNITNAENIFSIDYYEGASRVSAALATETKGKVYNHTKTICDRLNDSQLLDVRTVTLQGHELVYSQLQRANGSVEYALTFSIKNEGAAQRLYSLWNLDAYPAGDYRNFQVWGNSMGQVTTLVNHILNTLSQQKELKSFKGMDILPTVFIKNGYYKEGKLHLNVVNKVGASWLNIDGNYKVHEQEQERNLNKMITLSGAWEEEVIVDTGYLFDIGISILAENSYQYDAMYLADGPWGADMNPNMDAIAEFEIKEHAGGISQEGHSIERSVSAKGEVRETINIFRNLLAGDLQMDVTDYNFLQFNIQNDRPIEVSLVTDATDRWEERLRFALEPHTDATAQSIALTDFKNHEGKPVDFTQVKTIVFSVQGDYQTYAPFALEIGDMTLTTSDIPEEEEETQEEETDEKVILANFDSMESVGVDPIVEYLELKHYPNPFIEYTVVTLPAETERVTVNLTNLSGQMVYQDNLGTQQNNSAVRLEVPGLHPGMYVYTIMDFQNGRTYRGKLIKE